MFNPRRWLPVLTLLSGVIIGVAAVGLRIGSSQAFVVPPLAGASTGEGSNSSTAASARSPAGAAQPAPRNAGRGSTSVRYTTTNYGPHREELAGCHPDEDISCTIVRETTGGIVVFTRAYRDGSQVAVVPASGAPAVEFAGSGICVVPGRSVRPMTATSRFPNGAPILE